MDDKPNASVAESRTPMPAAEKGGGAPLRLAASLRGLSAPVIGRLADDRLSLDMRGLNDDDALAASLAELRVAGEFAA